MNRTELLQEIRKMRSEQAYGEWQKGQVTQNAPNAGAVPPATGRPTPWSS